jgi:penicillin amidase
MDDVRVDGLDDVVVIERDRCGIPSVRASSGRDAIFGQGFAQAQDRLGQLEYDRRRAYGRWAEVVGRGGLGFDVFARRCRLADAARREHDALDDESRETLGAFAAGVNRWLEDLDQLPPDLALAEVRPDPWEPWDCCAVFLVRHVAFANWQKKLWRGRLIAALGVEAVAELEGVDARATPLIVPPGDLWVASAHSSGDLESVLEASATIADPAQGSNAWAIGGSRTTSGRPLLAGDPHRFVEVPGVYYQVRLKCPDFDAAGLAFVGVPGFPHFGQTERVAWCVTNANGDYQDLYVERFRDASPLEYDAGSKWESADARSETIAVRDRESVTVECLETRHGPVVFGDPSTGYAVALRSTALVEPSSGLSVLARMLRARSVDELDGLMSAWVDPANNFVSADIDGNISYRTVGRIPVRAGANAWGPVPGWDDTYEWSDYVPYEEMPRLLNPDGDLIVTANQRIVGDDYPHYLGLDYAAPYRAERIHARLDDAKDVSGSDMPAVHRDRRSLGADVWVDAFCELEGADDYEGRALEVLRGWDRNMEADSAGAAIYVGTRDAVGRIVAHNPVLASLRAPITGEPSNTFTPLEVRLWALLTDLLALQNTRLLPRGRDWADVLAAGFSDGIGVLRTALGDDVERWRWGALHVCAPSHPVGFAEPSWGERLNPPGVEMGGEWDTVFSAAHAAGFGFGVTSASVARYVFDLADRGAGAWIVPLGASGDPESPHYSDQQASWAAGELIPIFTDG